MMKKIFNNLKYIGFWAFFLSANTVYAGTGELSGYVAMDTRYFLESPLYNQQAQGDIPNIVIEPEYYYVSDNNLHTLTARPFFRLDANDPERTHFDFRQLDWLYQTRDWEVKAGVSKVFWGVIESKHLVDIINQTDTIEDIDSEDKLGQPMIQYARYYDWGNVSFFYLPYFRKNTYPGKKGRIRAPVVVQTDRAEYDSGAEEWHPDFALRYDHTFGDWDIGVAHFSGTSREPVLQTRNFSGQAVLVPYYDLIDQTSLDLQFTGESWLWKLEAMSRSGQGDRFYAVSGGFEYTFYSIFDTVMDIGVLTEYHRDNRGAGAPLTLLDDDVFFGGRLTLNNIADTAFLGGVIFDTNTQARSWNIEVEHRYNDHWKIEFDARIISSNAANNTFEQVLRNDDFMQLRLARYF